MDDLRRRLIAALWLPVGLSPTCSAAQAARPPAQPSALPLSDFAALIADDETKASAALARIGAQWHESSAALLIEMVHHVSSRRVLRGVMALIESRTGKAFDGSLDPWYEWLW